MIIHRYGAAVLQFGSGDSVLALEVQRPNRQRPLTVTASLAALPVPAQQNSGTRLIIYRGAILTEPSHVSALSGFWEPLFGMNRVFHDVFFTPNQPVSLDLTHWPDELCRVEAGEALGAAILLPIDMTTGSEMHGLVVLSFAGEDVFDSEPTSGTIKDVRDLRAR